MIQARRKATEFNKKFATKHNYKTVDGIVEVVHPDGTYDVKVPGRRYPWTKLHCIIPNVVLFEGQGCVVGFRDNEPNLAMIVAAKFVGRAAPQLPGQLVLGEWMQWDASPLCNRRPPGLLAPFPYGIDEITLEASHLLFLDRHFPPDGITSTSMPGFYSSEGVVLRPGCVTAMTTYYNPTDTLVLGQLIKELDLTTSAVKEWRIPISNPFPVTETADGTHQGCLWWNPLNDLYTVTTRDGLVHLSRTGAAPRKLAWKATYFLPPEMNASVVSHTKDFTFALQGGWNIYNGGTVGSNGGALNGENNKPGSSTIHGYLATNLSQTFTGYRHAWSLQIPGLFPGFQVVQSCNGGGGRWPYLASLNSWVVWAFAKTGVDFEDGIPTSTVAKLLAINAQAGGVRVLEEFPAPIDLIPYRDDIIDTAEPDAIYNSTPHPDDWIPLGGGNFDKGHPVPPGADFLPEPPEGYGGSYYSNIVNYQGPTSETEVVAGHNSPLLACGNGGHYPRGIVVQTTAGSSYYVVLRLPATISAPTAREKLIPHGAPFNDFEFRYKGNYTDFGPGSTTVFGSTPVRVYHSQVEMMLQVDYRINPDKRYKPQLRHYDEKLNLIGTKDLSRLFTVDGTRYLREPKIWEIAVSGQYLWILLTDWTDKDTESFRVLCLDKDTRVEVATFSLGGDDRTLSGRPQLMAGEDAESAWARVFARWDYESDTKWLAQTVRVVPPDSASSGTFASTNPDEAPIQMAETANLAVREDRLYWLQDGKNLRQIRPTT